MARIRSCAVTMTFFVALTFTDRATGQAQVGNEQHQTEHHRYRLVDLGTLGGPASYFIEFEQILTNRGTLTGGADTSMPDPNKPNCSNADCFVSHTFRWRDGVMTDLGALPGTNNSIPSEINRHGSIVGSSQNGLIDPLSGFPESRAVMWRDSEIIDLGTLGGNESGGTGINNRDQVVGIALNAVPDPFSFVSGTQTRAFLWQNSVMRDLGTLGGADAFAQYINDRGQVAGFSYTNNTPTSSGVPQVNPFLWNNGTMMDLGNLGGTFGQVNDLNNRGQVVGTMNLAGDVFVGFLWDSGALTDLGTFGGDNSEANWINEAGDIVGKADLAGSTAHDAFLWRNGVMTNLGTLYSDPCSNATGINSHGQVVGTSDTPDCTFGLHAFFWDGSMTDLNAFVPPGASLQQLTVAFYIDDRGEIAGIGLPPGVSVQDQFSLGHIFVLIPCDNDEGRAGGCEEAHEVRTAVAESGIASTTHPLAVASQPNLTPDQMKDSVHALLGNHNRRFGGLPPN
jgi:probable HAF family extracellular repeat protein